MAERIRRREGDWFAVPLAAGGYGVGLVARAPRRGDTLLGYFFGPIRSALPGPGDIAAYEPDDAIRVCRFRDHPLVSGQWPIFAATEGWDRSAWPMPEFRTGLSEMLLGESRVVAYSEDDPSRFVHQRPISAEEASQYPPDAGPFPAEFLEHLVGEWLGAPHIEDEAASMFLALREEGIRHFLVVPQDGIEQARRQLIELGLDEVDVLDREDEEDDRIWITALQRGENAALGSTLDAMEASLTELAKAVGGVYDGPEWALPSP